MKPDLAARLGVIWPDRPELIAPLLTLANNYRHWLNPRSSGRGAASSADNSKRRARALKMTRALGEALDNLVFAWPVRDYPRRDAQFKRAREVLVDLADLLELQERRQRPQTPHPGRPNRIASRLELLRDLDALIGPLGIPVTDYRDGPFCRTYAALCEAAGVKIEEPRNDVRQYLDMG